MLDLSSSSGPVSTGLPTHAVPVLPAPDTFRNTLPVPPLWLGALAGLLTGLVTTALT